MKFHTQLDPPWQKLDPSMIHIILYGPTNQILVLKAYAQNFL